MNPITIEPEQPAKGCVIWLHGLGADGSDFIPVAEYMGLAAQHQYRVILPNAPVRPVTINNGFPMPAWYDILAMLPERQIAFADLQASADIVHQLIDEQIAKGVSSENILLVGFSQGGAVAYHSALSYPQRLGGIAALSTYIADYEALEPRLSKANKALPIWVAHGLMDDVVPMQLGEQAVTWLKAKQWPVEYKTYPMGHEVIEPQICDLGEWITGCLN
ncbi:MAG: alpha/beta hydrolase [Pontibacterium sp.]